MKEIVLRVDEGVVSRIEEELKQKRTQGAAKNLSDIFLIRLLESVSKNSKVLLFKLDGNRVIVKNYETIQHDDHR